MEPRLGAWISGRFRPPPGGNAEDLEGPFEVRLGDWGPSGLGVRHKDVAIVHSIGSSFELLGVPAAREYLFVAVPLPMGGGDGERARRASGPTPRAGMDLARRGERQRSRRGRDWLAARGVHGAGQDLGAALRCGIGAGRSGRPRRRVSVERDPPGQDHPDRRAGGVRLHRRRARRALRREGPRGTPHRLDARSTSVRRRLLARRETGRGGGGARARVRGGQRAQRRGATTWTTPRGRTPPDGSS